MNIAMATALALALSQPASGPRAGPQGTPVTAARPQPVQGAAPAAAPAAPAGVVTLDDALKIASERNLDLKSLQAQLDAAEEISWKAWSGYLPRVTASGAWQVQRKIESALPLGRVDVVPGYAGMVPIVLQPPHVLAGQIEATQAIFSPALWFGISSASKAERAARLGLENGRRSLLFGVASAYYAAAALKQAKEVTERLLEIAQRQEKDARVRFQAGAIAKVGFLRAEIDRARAEQDVKRSRNAFGSAMSALATLLDRSVDFDVAEPPLPPLPESPDQDALVRTALDRRLDVKAAREQVDAARAARNANLGRYLPYVGAFARYQRTNASSLLGAPENWLAGFQAQWQILDGGLREAEIREGNAKLAAAEAAARSAEAKARQEVVQALLDLDSARANASKAKEQRELAAENLRLVDVSYRAGAATAVEQADATAVLRNAEIGFTTESLGAQLAALRVLQAAGEFDPVPRSR